MEAATVIETALLVAAGITLVWLVVWDFRAHRLPDILNAAFALLGVAMYAWNGGAVGDVPDMLLGSVFGAGLLYAVRAFFLWRTGREGVGLGDVKYVAAAGLWVGIEHIFLVIGLGAALTLIAVLGLRLMRHDKASISGSTPLPFGPGLIAATVGIFCAMYF